MSNASIASRLEDACLTYETGRLSVRELASAVEFHVGAFEALRFSDYKALQSLANALWIEAWNAEEECEFAAATGRLVVQLRGMLPRITVQ